MKVEEFSVKYPLFVNLLSVFIILAGLFSAYQMNREAFPNFSFDIVTVKTILTGASPKEIEKLVTLPIEEKIEEVSGIDKFESISTEGLSLIVITLDPDVQEKERVINDIQRAVDRVEGLPIDIEDKPIVEEVETKDTPIVEVTLNSKIPYSKLRAYTKTLSDRIRDLRGVSSVVRMGYQDQEMRVEVDPDLLAKNYIALNDVITALRKQNRNVPGGKTIHKNEEFIIRTVGEFYTTEEIGNTVIRSNDLGNLIRVKDVATVSADFEEEDILYRTNGERAIKLVVIKRESADILDLVGAVTETIEEFKKEIKDDVNFELINDISFYVKRRLNILRNNATIGLFLVVGCLLIFLSKGVAFMTALGLPVAFLATFIFMKQINLTINLISMFGLIMVLGIIVDDAIIIGENIYHHLEKGEDPEKAAILGTKEVMIPVTSTILTTIVAFLPLMFMSGIMGKFVRTIPMVVIVALIASLLEAIFILPSHIAEVAKFGKWWKKNNGSKEKKKPGNHWLIPLSNYYEKILRISLRSRYFLLFVIGPIIIILTFIFFKTQMDFVLFEARGIEIFFVRAQAPVGTPLEETENLFLPIEEKIAALPDNLLDNFTSQIGIIQSEPNDPFTQRGSHVAQAVIFLTPAQGRKKTADEIINDLRPQIKNTSGFERVWIDRVTPGPPVGKPIAIRLRGEEFNELEKLAELTKEELKKIKGVVDIRDDYELGKRELIFKIKPQLAAFANLSVEEVAQTLQIAFEGGVATEIRNPEEDIDVVVQLSEKKRDDFSSFEKLLIRNTQGQLIPLRSVTTQEKDQGISAIKHYDRKRVVSVTANIEKGQNTSFNVNKIMKEKMKTIMKKFPRYLVEYGGEQEDTEKSLEDLKIAFFLALVMIFLILATNFQSLTQPLIIMSSIPLSLIGVVYSFYLHGLPFGFMQLLGTVGLAGVVVNDAIVLVDAINKTYSEGTPFFEAIVLGSKRRLRPVLLTTITTVLGLAPVVYGFGGKDPFLVPMALAITGGLVFATLLTLIVIPCIYMFNHDVQFLIHKVTQKICKREIHLDT